MSASDVAMSMEEFIAYYKKNKGLVRSARAYDAAGGQWVQGEEIFRRSGAYTLIVLQFKNKHFLRVTVKPSLKVVYAPDVYRSAAFWIDRNIRLTYEEKEFLEGMGGEPMSMDDILKTIERSGFPGKDALLKKIKKAL